MNKDSSVYPFTHLVSMASDTRNVYKSQWDEEEERNKKIKRVSQVQSDWLKTFILINIWEWYIYEAGEEAASQGYILQMEM